MTLEKQLISSSYLTDSSVRQALAKLVDNAVAQANGDCHSYEDLAQAIPLVTFKRAGVLGYVNTIFGGDIAFALRVARPDLHRKPLLSLDEYNPVDSLQESCGVLINIFARRNPADFARMVALNGIMIIAVPSRSYLTELRQPQDKLVKVPDRLAELFNGSFQLLDTKQLEYQLDLPSRNDIINLIGMMPPSYWRGAKEILQGLEDISGFHTTASFTILSFRRGKSFH